MKASSSPGFPVVLLRRYTPVLAVVSGLAVMASVFPSRHSGVGGRVDATGGSGQLATGVGPDAQVLGGPSSGATNAGAAISATSGSYAAASELPGAAGPPGQQDTTHCVKGREFDPAIAYWAPPCTPGTIGAKFPNNGGATSMGVTSDTVTLVDYVSGQGAQSQAVLKSQGGLVTLEQTRILDRAWETFINSHFVLYGRKVRIMTWAGKADEQDSQALLAEMDQIVETDHPFGLFWSTTTCKECYAELASKGVVTIGSRGSSDALANELSPYFYSAHESSTRIETAFAEWWCSQMSSKNVISRKVRWAGHQNAAQDLNGRSRVLGIITPNPPDNQDTVRNYMLPLLKRLCGEDVSHMYFYAQDTSTAAQQVAAGIAAMDTAANPATDVLCICDRVAPAYLLSGEQANNYWPENLVSDITGMAWDATARATYEDNHGRATQGCVNPSQGCEFDMEMGLMADGPQPGGNDSAGYKIYHAGGGQDPVAKDPTLSGNCAGGSYCVSAVEATVHAFNWTMLASLIENAGPTLTPAIMQARAPLMPAVGGGSSGLPLLQFAKGDYQWTQDARIAYWDKYGHSSYDSPPEYGTWTQVGSRYNLGEYLAAADGPPVPTSGRTGPGK